jgi:hypothetical protein
MISFDGFSEKPRLYQLLYVHRADQLTPSSNDIMKLVGSQVGYAKPPRSPTLVTGSSQNLTERLHFKCETLCAIPFRIARF